ARNCLGTRPDTGDLLVFSAGLLSELLSRRQAPHGATQELVRRELITTTCGGGPEGIRTPDLLNAIQTRSQLRHGPTLSETHDSPVRVIGPGVLASPSTSLATAPPPLPSGAKGVGSNHAYRLDLCYN